MSVIETKRLIIKQYTMEDMQELFKVLSSPITMKFWPEPFTIQKTEEWIKINIESYEKLGYGRWAVFLKENGKFIGDCGIMISEIDGKKENDLGYIIHYPYWKNGYGYEVACACKEYAFNILGMERLCANMAFDNEASRNVALKIGMKKEKEFYNSRNRNLLTYLYSSAKDK